MFDIYIAKWSVKERYSMWNTSDWSSVGPGRPQQIQAKQTLNFVTENLVVLLIKSILFEKLTQSTYISYHGKNC